MAERLLCSKRTLTLVIGAALSVTACYKYVNKYLLVESDPPGAKIEVDGEYVGDAPVTVTIPVKLTWVGVGGGPDRSGWDLDWADKLKRIYVQAIPIFPGQTTQEKVLSMEKVVEKDVTRVFFNMHLTPIPDKHELEIRKR